MIELLEHNKETYKKLCEVLSENNKCALVQATGTGKSYIAGKYIEEHDVKALILVPTNAISDSWDELLEGMDKKVDIVTYQAFAKEPGNYFDYDLVIADEMHHLGSGVWGRKFVDTYLQNENHKIIGLTATEIRYLDNSRDMAEEIFENIRVDGCDLPTAINTGVLPTFKYVSALYCDERDFDEWKEKTGKIKDVKVQEELKGKLDVCIKNMVSVKQAVNENLTDDYKKIIVFLNNVESKETALEMFKDVFPTANFYDVDYSKQRKANNEQISRFKADENRSVLFVVDMLNEGVHIKGTDCVIMFRKTVSPQVYLQQLGRGLASGAEKTPVIFDFMSNVNNIRCRAETGEPINIIETFHEKSSHEKKIIYKSYVSEIIDIINVISGIIGCKKWENWEDEFLRNNYNIMTAKQMAKHLGRTLYSTRARLDDLGLKKLRHFNGDEIKKIENIENKTINEIAKELNMSIPNARYYMKKYGINYKNIIAQKVTKEVEFYVLKNHRNKKQSEIAKELNIHVRSVGEILNKNGIYKVKRLSDEEKEIIIDMIKEKKSCSEISRKIKRDKGTVLKFIRENGLHYQPLTICIKRRVVQLDSNFNYIETFESIREASRKTNLVSIGGCLQKRMKTCGGYKWMYEEDYKKMLEEQKAGD